MTTTSRTDNPTAAPIPSFNSFAKLPAFDAASFTQAFKLLGFDVKTVLDIQRRNVEALSAANQTITQGLQTVVRRQGEIARQSVKQVQDLLSVKPASVTETLVKRIELTKTAYEKTGQLGRGKRATDSLRTAHTGHRRRAVSRVVERQLHVSSSGSPTDRRLTHAVA